jgi:hypothetical protein
VYETVHGHTSVHNINYLPPMVKREELVRRVGLNGLSSHKGMVILDPQSLSDINNKIPVTRDRLARPDLFDGPKLKNNYYVRK